MSHVLHLPLFEFATLQADRERFIIDFGDTLETIIQILEKLVEDLATSAPTIIPIHWKMQLRDVSERGVDYYWIAVKAGAGSSDPNSGTLPAYIEPQLLVQRLVDHAGTSVRMALANIPYMGGLIAKGHFLKEPIVVVFRPPETHPVAKIAELYKSGEFANSQIMTGFALNGKSGEWVSNMWLYTADGTVVDTIPGHTSYFGVCMSPEGAEYFSRPFGKAGD